MFAFVVPHTARARVPLLRTAAALAALALGTLAWVFFGPATPTLSAAELLRASGATDAAWLGRPGVVGHRAFTITTRRLSGPTASRTQYVDVWTDPRVRTTARRLYDERHRLVGGEWTGADGSRVVYRAGAAPTQEKAGDAKPLTVDSIWRWDPSAVDYTRLVDVTHVRATSTDVGFALTFQQTSGVVAEAELELDHDHAAVSQRVVLRQDEGLVEMVTARSVAEVVPAADVAATVFTPESILTAAPPEVFTPRVSVEAPRLTHQDLDRLELSASYHLRRLGPCLSAPGEIRADPREFRIHVVTVSDECSREVEQSLGSLGQTPGVVVEVELGSPPEAARGVEPETEAATAPSVRDTQAPDFARMPLYADLYEVYARQVGRRPEASPTDLDPLVRPLIQSVVSVTLGRSADVLVHANDLESLEARWPPDRLAPLGLDSAAMWRAMLRDNARAIRLHTEVVLASMLPVLGNDGAEPHTNQFENLQAVRAGFTELISLARSNDAQIRRAFAVDPGDHQAGAFDKGRLLSSLRLTVRLAERLEAPWPLER